MTASTQLRTLAPAEYSSYESIDLDRLVIYAVARLVEMNLELSLENIIVTTFRLFPKKFSLVGYPEFPDATRVEKCLWRCKGTRRGWLGGKTPHGYILTEKGRMVADHAASLLASALPRKGKTASQTRRKESIIAEVSSSRAFDKYVRGEGDKISEAEFCNVLQGTLDSLKETLRENLDSLKVIADEVERKDISGFVEFLQNRFAAFLNAE
jgi:hypothetical protein